MKILCIRDNLRFTLYYKGGDYAERFGISRKTLYRKIRKYGLA